MTEHIWTYFPGSSLQYRATSTGSVEWHEPAASDHWVPLLRGVPEVSGEILRLAEENARLKSELESSRADHAIRTADIKRQLLMLAESWRAMPGTLEGEGYRFAMAERLASALERPPLRELLQVIDVPG